MKDPSSPSGNVSGENPSPLTSSGSGVLWLPVSGLAAVLGAITLCWIIYRLYLPQLLGQFGFPKGLAASVLIIESLLAVVMEPLMGGLSDQARRWVGTRFPFISLGVILSSALYITIPAIAIFGNPTGAVRWMLLIILIAWALAMTVFRSPAICLLGQYATPSALPQAASLLILSGGLIGAFGPFASKLILGWGPGVTFAIASFVLLGATAVLRFLHPPETPALSAENSELSPLRTSNFQFLPLGLIFVTGAGVAWGSSFLMQILRKVVTKQLNGANIDGVMFVIAIALAFAALPAGALAVKLGNRRMMLIGIGATIGLMMLIALMPSLVIVVLAVVALVVTFSLIVNGAFPYALSLVPPQRAGLGIGMYFGGGAAAGALFGVVFPQSSLSVMTPMTGAVLGAIAFLMAGLCIAASTRVVAGD